MAQYRAREFALDDLDIAILRELPVEGSKHGKYLNDGRSVKDLIKGIDPNITSAVYAGRLNALKFAGMVVSAKGAQQGVVLYQATQEGKKAASNMRVVKNVEAQASQQA